MELSVVTTLYKSEIYLDRFLERITKAIEKICLLENDKNKQTQC